MMGIIAPPATTYPNNGRIDEAIGEVLGFFFTLMLWIVLAIPLLAGGVAGEMQIVAASLLLLSGVAAICAGVLSLRYHGWAIVVAASLPPLIALYAMWARLPAVHAALPAKIVNPAAWGAILILTIAPLPLSVVDANSYAAREALQACDKKAAVSEREQKEALERARDVVRFQGLTAASPLGDFLYDLTFSDRDVDWPPDVATEVAHHYDQALAKARQVKTRQTDAVTLLKQGRIGDLKDLWQFVNRR